MIPRFSAVVMPRFTGTGRDMWGALLSVGMMQNLHYVLCPYVLVCYVTLLRGRKKVLLTEPRL